MIPKKPWHSMQDKWPENGQYCIVRRVLPGGKEWIAHFDDLPHGARGCEWALGYDPRLGRVTHRRPIAAAERKELVEKDVLFKRHRVLYFLENRWDYNWYE